jgi:hypothetical protein
MLGEEKLTLQVGILTLEGGIGTGIILNTPLEFLNHVFLAASRFDRGHPVLPEPLLSLVRVFGCGTSRYPLRRRGAFTTGDAVVVSFAERTSLGDGRE